MISGLSRENLINHFFSCSLSISARTSLWFLGLLLLQAACNNTELKEPIEYNGPLRKAENIEMFYTEKDRVKVKMVAAELHEFQNGDREFPKGIYIEFF